MENKTLDDKIKTLEAHFGRVVSTVKCLKTSVDDLKMKLEEKEEKDERKEIQEVLETQTVVEEVSYFGCDT